MGAIEFPISSFILNVFGAYCYILHPDYFISYWDLNDIHGRSDINALNMRRKGRILVSPLINVDPDSHFPLSFSFPRPLPTSMLDILRQKRFEPFLKINIDEGGGGEIVQIFAFLTCFPSFRIAPMFSLILPPPLRILPY